MKILVILPRFPFPLEKGDKLRAYNQIRYLSAKNEIFLFALNNVPVSKEQTEALQPYCSEMEWFRLTKTGMVWNILRSFFRGDPLQVGYFFNRRALRKLQAMILRIRPDHIYCQLLRVAEYASGSDLPKTLDYQDVFSKGAERRIALAPFYMKPVLRMEYKRLLAYERKVFDRFDHKTIITVVDRDLIPHPEKNRIQVIPNGVDFDFYRPGNPEKKYDLVFIGNMGYPPNINAAKFLVNRILPEVRKTRPDVKAAIVGANPHPDVRALASGNIEVTGWVEDTRIYYAASRIFIAPMQIGTGLQNKLLEAMAMKIPCITSPLANSALEAREEEEIRVGDTLVSYAAHISFLLDHPDQAGQMAENAFRFVKQHYDWEKISEKLDAIMRSSC